MFRARLTAVLPLLIGAVTGTSPAGACSVWRGDDARTLVRREAEVVVVGRVDSITHLVDPEARRMRAKLFQTLGERADLDDNRRQEIINRTDWTTLDLEVEEVLLGWAPSRITISARSIGVLPDSRRVLVGLRSVGTTQHLPNQTRRVDSTPALSVIGGGCSGEVLLDADGQQAAAVRSMLATSSLSRWGWLGLVLGIGLLAASALIRRKAA